MNCLIGKQTQVLGDLEFWAAIPINSNTQYAPKCTKVLAESIPVWKAKWLMEDFKKTNHSGLFRWRMLHNNKYRNL